MNRIPAVLLLLFLPLGLPTHSEGPEAAEAQASSYELRVLALEEPSECAAQGKTEKKETATKQKSPQGEKQKAPTTAVARDGCVTSDCHQDVKKHEYLHGPLFTNACDSCHKLVDVKKHLYEDKRPSQELCLFCHEIQQEEGDHVHEPLKKGECLSCHAPHGGTGPKLLRGKEYPDSCKNCHKEMTGDRNYVHGPASAGSCGACHEPHVSKNRKLLSETGNRLCLRCHVTVELEIETQHLVHAPVKDSCEICHDPHATDNAALLVSDPVTLCTKCHEGIGHDMDEAKTKHGALETDRACLECHDPHASDHPRLLREEPKKLCLKCHHEELQTPSGKTIANIKKKIEGAKSVHGPVADGDCVACHQVHGSGHKRLLKTEYASELYYPFKESQYALCFSCHDRELVNVEKTKILTGFRNGETNLHYVHVHREKKSRSCRVCHDAHATRRQHHIRETFPYGPGKWNLPVGWKASPNGGSCAAGCHPAFTYDRKKPVVYPERKKDGKDWRGKRFVPGVKPEKKKEFKNQQGED